jgi:hypothetical protein
VIRRLPSAAAVALFCLAGATAARAEPVTTIRANGLSSNRIDIAVLGDGYTAAEIASGKYASDVETAIAGLFAEEPYREYQRYFNVHRIDVTSIESGADHPSQGIFRDTALDAAYDCFGVQRLICVNVSAVNEVLTASIDAPSEREVILVIVNDPQYGGSGGSVAVASTHTSAVELVLHEVGHSFALLADEYFPDVNCNASIEPAEANATRETSRSAIKWHLWIDPSTPIPTSGTTETPGLYTGAKYCQSGLYRPTFNSKMRSLGRPFGAINAEAHVTRIYNFVTPLDTSLPAASSFTVARGQSRPASVTTPQPFTHALTVTWTVDGAASGSGTSFVLDTTDLPVGQHTMAVTVVDETSVVRNDPDQLLRATRTWQVTVSLSFTDYPLQTGMVLKAVHITELRSRVNDLRVRCGIDAFAFTDPTLTPAVTVARAVHVLELRTALNGAYTACSAPAPTYTDPMLDGLPIKAIHVSELREAVLALE